MRRGRGIAPRVLLVALAAPVLAGCFDDPTEVVVVLDTDAKVGRDFANVQLCFSNASSDANADGRTWPVTVGVRKQGTSSMFTVLVKLNTTPAPGQCDNRFMPPGTVTTPPPFDTRTAKDVQFVDGEMRTLFLPLLKACACVDAAGMPTTSCPHALDPGCEDLTSPKLGDFDENNLPHLPASAKAN
jgi:hypothetical protein